jgi:hypothetical protein
VHCRFSGLASFAQKLHWCKQQIAMPQFENIETRVLLDILAEYTEKFAQLFRFHKRINPSKEYLRCKYTIEAILNVLNKRKGVVKQEKETYMTRYEEVCLSGL